MTLILLHEADIDVHTDEMNLEIPERDGADASAGDDTFVAHQKRNPS